MICRRSFLKCAAVGTGTAAASASWLTFSQSRAALLGRRLWDDARRNVAAAALTPEPSKWAENGITLAWLGHSSVLINFYGMFI